MSSPPFYITTPIYYVNATPHLGTFYSTAVADTLARFHRLRGQQVFFLTGLDEHGQKIERIARERGQDLQTYCDGVAAKFQETWKLFGMSNDDFVRTTQARHKAAVTAMWNRMMSSGDIYEKDYDSLYCVGCEEFKTQDDVIEENGQTVCPIHHKPLERVQEKNYFFRLSAYAERLLAWYDQADPVWPASRRNEVAEFVKRGLQDISVSRPSVKWGIPVPGNPAHTVYVWIDALTNYLTALGGPEAVEQKKDKGIFWAGAHHLIAKDILRFHAVYWPAMLMSAGLPPPKKILCHGYLTVKGQKISKSIPATKVDPVDIANELGVEPLRFFVLREYSFGGDGDFTYEALLQRYESDLGNDLGNLLNRTVSMARQYLGGVVPACDLSATEPDDGPEREVGLSLAAVVGLGLGSWDLASQRWTSFNPSGALECAWALARRANKLIEDVKPWVLAKAAKAGDKVAQASLEKALAVLSESLRRIAVMIAPALPGTADGILTQLGLPPLAPVIDTEAAFGSGLAKPRWRLGEPDSEEASWHWEPGTPFEEPKPLFPRLDPTRKTALITRWTGGVEPNETVASPEGVVSAVPSPAPAAAAATQGETPSVPKSEVAMDDFAKIELRAAKVLTAERVPKTEKLLKLTLDLGTEQRTVVSGIAAAYAPEAMVGRTVIYLANLKPAKIRGVLSQGMILAAGDHDVLALSALDRDVPPGTVIR